MGGDSEMATQAKNSRVKRGVFLVIHSNWELPQAGAGSRRARIVKEYLGGDLMKVIPCICCGKSSKHSVRLAEGFQANDLVALPRYYLPNIGARDPDFPADLKEVYFCVPCMRRVEDAVRATILYLQAENDRLSIKSSDA
jgi:hypothetical protein